MVAKKRQLKQRIRAIVSVAASFALVAILVHNYRHEREIEQRLADMQKLLQASPPMNTPIRGAPISQVILDSGDVGSEEVRRQHNLEEIESAGWKLVNQRSPEQAAIAVRIFSDGIANVDAHNPQLYNGLGRALLVAGKPREAIAAWRKGLGLDPHFSDMQSGIGWAYWRLNDPSRAKDAWQQALDMNPHSIDAWSAMAWIDLALGKNTEAMNGFQDLLKFDSGQKSWVMGLSMARGNNTDIAEISTFFPLPPLSGFERPLSTDPAS